jgi:prepilin-type processing-associated H-X9-DG protein
MKLRFASLALAATVLALTAVSATTPASAFSRHSNTVNFLFSDGSVRFLP